MTIGYLKEDSGYYLSEIVYADACPKSDGKRVEGRRN